MTILHGMDESKQNAMNVLYDNEYASIIDIYFYEFFQPFQT